MENDINYQEENLIPDNVSPLRYILTVAGKDNLINIDGFKTAIETKNATLIMEGDWGGQIYLTCPAEYVKCKEENLLNLLVDLDDLAWGDQGENSRKVLFEIRKPGEGISGGMGGGLVIDGLWVHEEFEDIKDEISEVIGGAKERIKK
jgi:hypothetical protein